jgi:hypothetical protein
LEDFFENLKPFFLGFDPKKISIKMIYIQIQKIKRSFWGIFEDEAVVLGYSVWRNRRSRFGVLFAEN